VATTTSENGSEAAVLEIDRIVEERLTVPIVGTSPLIMHRFSEKARLAMLHAAQGKRVPKTPKDPQSEYESAAYRFADGKRYGMPADAFKQATVAASRFYGKDVTQVLLRQSLFIVGEAGDDGRALIEIQGADPIMREDVVRVGRGGTDLRYRPLFFPWHATLEVVYFPGVLTRQSVLSLIDAGGLAVGVGEWRPERDGTFGTYRVSQDDDIEVLS